MVYTILSMYEARIKQLAIRPRTILDQPTTANLGTPRVKHIAI